jgi:hypothetical protein
MPFCEWVKVSPRLRSLTGFCCTFDTKVHENRGISKRMKIKIKATGTLTGLPYRARSTNLTFVSWLFSTNEIN